MTRLLRILDAFHARLGRFIGVLEACEAVAEAPAVKWRARRCSGCGCTFVPSWDWPGSERLCGMCEPRAHSERPS